jgi:hypothetical protein
MRLEELLVANGIIDEAGLKAASDRRTRFGGQLSDNLLALRLVSLEQLNAVLQMTPPATPSSIVETGLSPRSLMSLVLKAVQSGGAETVPQLIDILKLPSNLIQSLAQDAVHQRLLKVVGSDGGGSLPVLTYGLTELGRSTATEATAQNKYVGPAPVPITSYIDQVKRQSITNERINRERINRAFADLVTTPAFVNRIGPAINSGRSILLYGPPGNGKSSIAEKIGRIFTDIIYVPYCIEVDGQIITVFDPSVHEPIKKPAVTGREQIEIRGADFDRRWVACRRPVIIVGGELTLDMLDLRYSETSKYYEAPLHIKALGGTFVIDDFGRQFVRPTDLLNRWIVPLEERIDYLKLNTGAIIQMPFDELIIFSTNMTPNDLMDPAFLRRIPYKLELTPPSPEDYKKIFRQILAPHNLEMTETLFSWVIDELQGRRGLNLACYQPGFIAAQILNACQFEGRTPEVTEQLIIDALANLYAASTKPVPDRAQVTPLRPVAAVN